MLSNSARTDGSPAARKLLSYYSATAEQYDGLHGDEEEHQIALRLTAAFVQRLQPGSLLDVGCGTGRALAYFRAEFPEVKFQGADPSPELLRVAIEQHGIPAEWLDVTSGESLPYPDSSFDVVVATGVLHHVAEPSALIDEMLRVSKLGIFISDGNTYGNASNTMARIKVAARVLGVIRQLEWVRHGGKRWSISAGDGLHYPFSVFDCIEQLRRQCAAVFVIPTKGRPNMASYPLRHASHALVCALKFPLGG